VLAYLLISRQARSSGALLLVPELKKIASSLLLLLLFALVRSSGFPCFFWNWTDIATQLLQEKQRNERKERKDALSRLQTSWGTKKRKQFSCEKTNTRTFSFCKIGVVHRSFSPLFHSSKLSTLSSSFSLSLSLSLSRTHEPQFAQSRENR